MGTAVARTGVSFYSAELLYSASVRAFLHNVGLDEDDINQAISQSCTPSRKSFGEYIDETAAEKLAWLREELRDKVVFLACDKGHKKGIGHFVKFVCYWDDEVGKVEKYLMDCEASGGSMVDCVKAIDFSMGRLDLEQSRLLLAGQCTDAGGGGVGEDLKKELIKVNRVSNPVTYLAPTCSLHAIQLLLCNAVKVRE